jgi:hypothetical protein
MHGVCILGPRFYSLSLSLRILPFPFKFLCPDGLISENDKGITHALIWQATTLRSGRSFLFHYYDTRRFEHALLYAGVESTESFFYSFSFLLPINWEVSRPDGGPNRPGVGKWNGGGDPGRSSRNFHLREGWTDGYSLVLGWILE